MLGVLEGDTLEGANVWPISVGACVAGAFVGAGDVGLAVGPFEGLTLGPGVDGLAVGRI